ncbi:MAG: putative metal-binding motif-containing protein [Polyangiales bacterium]
MAGTLRALFFLAATWSVVACGSSRVQGNLGDLGDASAAGDGATDGLLGEISVPDADPTLGGPCLDDMQCARPEIPCATFKCDLTVKRCRATPDDTRCDDGLYCNGQEKCDPRLGCIPGAVVDCSSGDTCAIDRCVEETRTCTHSARDADDDGDPTNVCAGGKDCDDSDPTVSSKAKEICGNKKDDNCNGTVDESPCVTPDHATCDTALIVSGPGTYALDLTGTARTVPASCAPTTEWVRQDVVAIKVADGDAPVDVDVVASSLSGARVALASGKACGDGTTETGCAAQPPTASSIRLKMRNLAAGTYPLYVLGASEGKVELKVSYLTPTPPATNLSCATALPLLDGTTTSKAVGGEIVDVGKLSTSCSVAAGPLVYKVEIPDGPRDLRVRVTAASAGVRTIVGVRDAGCSSLTDEIKCGQGNPADLFMRALPTGTYYVTAGVSAPSDVTVDATLSPATTAAANETCAAPPALPNMTTVLVDMKDHADDIAASCIAGPGYMPIALDAAYDLKLDVASDVLVVGRPTGSDQIGLGISTASCVAADYGCARGYPTRISRRALPAGDYRVFVESLLGAQPSLSTFVRPAATPGPAGADKCTDTAIVIPKDGGLFVGSTAGKTADFDASCDTVGLPKGGAPDVVYRLDLDKKGRLIVDLAGSAYTTTVSVRKGATCPGVELDGACAAGYVVDNAFLDISVDPGTYWIVVDGYSLASGSYRLDVRVAPPSPMLP